MIALWVAFALANEPAANEPAANEPAADEPASTPPAPEAVAPETTPELAESRRLRDELQAHAKAGRHAAVDRTYLTMVERGLPIERFVHGEAAQAALALGHAGAAVARYHRAGDLAAVDDIASRYGPVRISSSRIDLALGGEERFVPDERAAVAWVNEQLKQGGRFAGLLPAGAYPIGGRTLVVAAGAGGGLIIE